MNEDNKYIMWLASINNIKLSVKRNLLEYFGSGKELWQADSKDLKYSKIASQAVIEKIVAGRYKYSFDKELEKMKKIDAKFYTEYDKEYPEKLKYITNAPLGIYLRGKVAPSNKRSVAVVGSRRITEYGAMCCEKFSGELAQNGICVVSGLAMGTDAVAHNACLKGGGTTFAVLGTGVDNIYPTCNTNLGEKIMENGCIISEFPLETRAFPANFPIRNRIISGMCDVTIVIEADEKSGTMITANHALEQGRTVMALPGNITSRLSRGTNNLIRLGAAAVTKTEDILEELNITIPDKNTKENIKNSVKIINGLAPNEKLVYDCMDYEPITIDEIIEKINLNIQDTSCALTMLEVQGLIQKMSGQKYSKVL